MPLGIFGSNGPKPQPLTSDEKRDKGGSSAILGIDIKDSKGSTIKLGKKSYTVERKLAEVTDKHGRNYALKRQLIRDDPRQLEACRTECQIVKNLNGHKNIITYVDHQLSVNKAGIYDYMLLTIYYPTNVLQLMNSRLLSNRSLSAQEILDIFCDVCEAVARLHHSKTPVIHRDLKVENVLIDQRTGNEKPVYVLCDFGSATTKVLSKDSHSLAYVEEEIQRYTTLSYRAPEMIDLFGGVPISTKSDIWAMGILLYKLGYFSLPFGESSLAIQNGTFSFPDSSTVSDEIKAIINLLLTSSAHHRPNIYQTSYLAFSANNRKCPVYNIEKSPRIELTEAVQILRLRDKLGANYARLFEKAFNEFESAKKKKALQPTSQHDGENVAGTFQAAGGIGDVSESAVLSAKDCSPSSSSSGQHNNSSSSQPAHSSNQHHASLLSSHGHNNNHHGGIGHHRRVDDSLDSALVSAPKEGVIVNTGAASSTAGAAATTSVNPRLRPKATNTFGASPFGVVVVPPASNRQQSVPTPQSTTVISTSVVTASEQAPSTSSSYGDGGCSGTVPPPHHKNSAGHIHQVQRQQQQDRQSSAIHQQLKTSSSVSSNMTDTVDSRTPVAFSASGQPPLFSALPISFTATSTLDAITAATDVYSPIATTAVIRSLPLATDAAGGGAGGDRQTLQSRGGGICGTSSCLRSSAFQPYTQRKMMAAAASSSATVTPRGEEATSSRTITTTITTGLAENVNGVDDIGLVTESSNPFISAFVGSGAPAVTVGSPPASMDDNAFGERFDELRRLNRRNTIEAATALTTQEASASAFGPIVAASSSFKVSTTDKAAQASTGQVSSAPFHPARQQLPRLRLLDSAGIDATLERAFEEDPFGRAPPILPHQTVARGSGGGAFGLTTVMSNVAM